MKSCFLSFVFLLLPLASYCIGNLSFYNINDTYGIANRETTSICKDADGFTWIASKTGIMRLRTVTAEYINYLTNQWPWFPSK
jgi:hypothetical protein